ncbi:MAG: helix-turn-helix transcriptional regulator [Spirochaetales bacterium]|nr:helix-turn-helix transcriptional regulator [Spirochaetales bacterium]
MKLLFFVRNIVINEKNRTNITKHSHDFHEILYCTESNSTIITSGDLLFYPAGQDHFISYEKGNQIKLYQLYFSEELFSTSVNIEKEALYILGQIKLYLKKGNLLRLSRIGSERILKLFESMRWEFTKRYRGYSWTIRLKLIELLVTVIRDREFKLPIRGEMGKPLSNSHIQDVLLYLDADYMNRITIENVLQFSPLSRSHFHALFKKETGETFIGYLNKLRCEKACEMLVATDDTVLDISLKAGFNNLSHFCHTFKEIKGISPTKFRSQAMMRNPVLV